MRNHHNTHNNNKNILQNNNNINHNNPFANEQEQNININDDNNNNNNVTKISLFSGHYHRLNGYVNTLENKLQKEMEERQKLTEIVKQL